MDFDTLGDNIIPILIVVGLIILQLFVGRKRRGAKSQQQIVQSLLLEVRLNQTLVETFNQREKPKKFENTGWRLYKNRLDFLSQSIQTDLTNAYMIIDDFNIQIESAKKFKSTSYMVSVDANRLQEPLRKCREELEKWLQLSTGSREPETEYRGMMDNLFGGR